MASLSLRAKGLTSFSALERGADADDLLVTPLGPMLRMVYTDDMRDKSYENSPLGRHVKRYLSDLRWRTESENTPKAYEEVLAKFARDHDDFENGAADFGGVEGMHYCREFLTRHWDGARPATRRQRRSILKAFFEWAKDAELVAVNPVAKIGVPRLPQSDRVAYDQAVLLRLVASQESLRDQCALQLLCRMGLRKDEVRMLRIKDVDLVRDLIFVRGKGSKDVLLPIGFKSIRDDLYLHIQGESRTRDEYLLYPRSRKFDPLDPSSMHRWLKRCLVTAGLPETIKMHELRHSAADHLWRGTGNLLLAKEMLRHSSVATTENYLHPTRKDLADAMLALDSRWGGDE